MRSVFVAPMANVPVYYEVALYKLRIGFFGLTEYAETVRWMYPLLYVFSCSVLSLCVVLQARQMLLM